MLVYSAPEIKIGELYCDSAIFSTCTYFSCLVNSNQHEYIGDLSKYSSLSELLTALKSSNYGYTIVTYENTQYYVWTSQYSNSESTNQSYLTLLEGILGITRDDKGTLSGDWSSYVESGSVHITTYAAISTMYTS